MGEMKVVRASILCCLVLLASAACEGRDGNDHSDETSAVSTHASGAAAADSHPTAEHAAGHAGEAGQALLPIMQRLGNEMTALTYALMTDDHAAVTRSAAAIAEHAPISAEELARIRKVLGSDVVTFNAIDDSVHRASVRLHDAARTRELDQVMDRLAEVQHGCVSCHTQFRARLRTTPDGVASPR